MTHSQPRLRLTRRGGALVLVLSLGFVLVCGLIGLRPDLTRGYPPCPTEDSNACYWDASQHGNGLGRSFTALPDGTLIFWKD